MIIRLILLESFQECHGIYIMKEIKGILTRMVNPDSWGSGLISVKFFLLRSYTQLSRSTLICSLSPFQYTQPSLAILIVYAVSSHSKGCIFSLGLCYNMILALVQRQWEEAKWSWGGQASTYKALTSGEALLLFAGEERLVSFNKGGGVLGRLKIKQIWAFQFAGSPI